MTKEPHMVANKAATSCKIWNDSGRETFSAQVIGELCSVAISSTIEKFERLNNWQARPLGRIPLRGVRPLKNWFGLGRQCSADSTDFPTQVRGRSDSSAYGG